MSIDPNIADRRPDETSSAARTAARTRSASDEKVLRQTHARESGVALHNGFVFLEEARVVSAMSANVQTKTMHQAACDA